MIQRNIVFVPIRRAEDDGHEWFDTESLGLSIEVARMNAFATDTKIRQWAKANPVIGFARCECREIERFKP